MTAVLLFVIFGFCGLAIDLGLVYNRRVELQTAADSIALAAAAQLDGTDAGVARALAAAAETASEMSYQYNQSFMDWSDSAIGFAASPYASSWFDAASAPSKAATLFFAKVDTTRLDARHGNVETIFFRVFGSSQTSAQTQSRAIAGRSSINLMPLAICAMSSSAATSRGSELVEYGFRRGINYDLMQLNPNDTSQGANFLVNPLAPVGTTGTSLGLSPDMIRPFVCTGTLGIPHVLGGKITVERNFPLGDVFTQLNSRFGTYASPCTSSTAPPDSNVKAYTYSTVLTWMNNVPAQQSAVSRTSGSALMTLPDLPPADIPGTTTADMYGPLWLYGKPAKFASYTAGSPEPAGGYATFGVSDWPTLYPKGTPKLKPNNSYPSPTPYAALSQSPPGGAKGVAGRRVLNIPLLSCPVLTGSPSTADVLAVARFFMTVPATSHELYAEFVGVAQPSSLFGQVELYP